LSRNFYFLKLDVKYTKKIWLLWYKKTKGGFYMRRCKHCMSSFKIEIARWFFLSGGILFSKGSRTRGGGIWNKKIAALKYSLQKWIWGMIFLGKKVLRGRGKHVSLKRGPIAERALKMFFSWANMVQGERGLYFFYEVCKRSISVYRIVAFAWKSSHQVVQKIVFIWNEVLCEKTGPPL